MSILITIMPRIYKCDYIIYTPFISTTALANMANISAFMEDEYDIQNGNVTSQSSIKDNPSDPYEYRYYVVEQLFLVCSFIFLIFGSTGNILSFIVMCQKSIQNSTPSMYFAAIAISDQMHIMVALIPSLIAHFHGWVLKYSHPWACKLDAFIRYSSGDISVWLLVSVTFDRFFAIVFPLKARIFCTRKRAKLICVLVCMLAIMKNVHLFWTRGFFMFITLETGDIIQVTNCGSSTTATNFFEKAIRPWLAYITVCLIPSITILILNIIIIVNLQKSKSMNKHKSSTIHQKGISARTSKRIISNESNQQVKQLTVVLLSVSITFLILVSPFFTLIVFQYFLPLTSEEKHIIARIGNILFYANHSINFVLYTLTSSGFRKELCFLLSFYNACQNGTGDSEKENKMHTSNRTSTPGVASTPLHNVITVCD